MKKNHLVLRSLLICLFVLGCSQLVFAVCGNGRCQPLKGENCVTCPKDCGICGGNWDDISVITPEEPIDWQKIADLKENINKNN